MDFTKYLKSEIEKEMNTWVEKDIYAISFLLTWAEDDETSDSFRVFRSRAIQKARAIPKTHTARSDGMLRFGRSKKRY